LEKEIEVAKSIGATEQDFAPLRNALLHDPLHRLENLQRRGFIDGADEINFEPD